MSQNGKTPEAQGWRENAHQCTGVNIGHGGVQFIGTHAVLLGEVAVTIPFQQLAGIIANVFAAIDPAHPAHAAMFAPPHVIQSRTTDAKQLGLLGD